MSTPLPVIAVFDVGKTNKKIFLFDEGYRILYEQTDRLAETMDDDGDSCEDIGALRAWCLDTWQRLQAKIEFSIKAVNFCAYGASFVHIDEAGKTIMPLYNYLKPYPAWLKKSFFDTYGGEEAVSMITCSPVLDSLNSGLQLYRLKHEKQLLLTKGFSLHLPQYLSWLITGRAYSDITSIGCHTMLWDFSLNAYHRWVSSEHIDSRLAPIFPGDEVVPGHQSTGIFAGIGLHDSSSALIPYLSAFQQPFVLISTGTWCISLNPFNNEPLSARELEQDCLCYLSFTGDPVKASRLFAGHEHEVQVKRLADHFKKPTTWFEHIAYSQDTVMQLRLEHVQDSGEKFSPQASAFPQRQLSDFNSAAKAYHQLMMEIVTQQVWSTRLVMQEKKVKRIFVDGGFSKNAIYMHLLSQAFAELEVFAASVAQATALGAALAIHRHWNSRDIPADLIDLKYYSSGSPTG